MKLFIIIYIAGYVANYLLYRRLMYMMFRHYTKRDRAFNLIASSASWLGFIAGSIHYFKERKR